MEQGKIPLALLRQGQSAAVEKMEACGGSRRLRDLGVIPGAEIRCVYAAPSGSPVAYEIFGAVVALRRGIAERIWVRPWD